MVARNKTLYQKYRPDRLSHFVGNNKLKKDIFSMVENNEFPKVMILSGKEKGCGRDTFARLVAQEYFNPDNSGYITCQKRCPSTDSQTLLCSPNIREVGIADLLTEDKRKMVASEIKLSYCGSDNPSYRQVFIFHNVQMMTKEMQAWFSEVLNTQLEMKSRSTMIVLCTDGVVALPDCITSCCQFVGEVKSPKESELENLMKEVCTTEGIKYNTEGIHYLVNAEDTFRSALMTLEYAVTECNIITKDTVKYLEGVVSDG